MERNREKPYCKVSIVGLLGKIKTILANMPRIEVVEILNQLKIDSSTLKKTLDQLDEIHDSGYAISYGEKTEGTASIAAPIIGYHNQIIGALSIGILSYTITEDQLAYLIAKITSATKEISIQLGKQK
jgi:DNA-binding IclR family transcriptional regulator